MNKKPIYIKKGQNIYKVYFQSSEKMDQVKDKSVQLIFTSPPYYNLKEYKSLPKKDIIKLSDEEYLNRVDFSLLLDKIAKQNPNMRIRFSTSNPQDMKNDVLCVIAKHENICNYIHLPVQSGSSKILNLMNRGYTREWYLNRINAINNHIPNCGLSSDFMSGFCNETEEDHKLTLSLMETVKYHFSYMFQHTLGYTALNRME